LIRFVGVGSLLLSLPLITVSQISPGFGLIAIGGLLVLLAAVLLVLLPARPLVVTNRHVVLRNGLKVPLSRVRSVTVRRDGDRRLGCGTIGVAFRGWPYLWSFSAIQNIVETERVLRALVAAEQGTNG
jgi:hypothetical protein